MTRVETIKFGTAWLGLHDDLKGTELYEFFKMAVKALQEEPCDDCVKRQEVLAVLKDKWGMFSDANDAMQESINAIKALQPVTPQPKMGRWITKMKSDLRGDMWPTNPKCSECGGEPYYSNTIYNYKFCPYCGAKMESNELKEMQNDKRRSNRCD